MCACLVADSSHGSDWTTLGECLITEQHSPYIFTNILKHAFILSAHGNRSRGTGGQVPQNFELGTLMQIVPTDFVKMPIRIYQNTSFQAKNSAFTARRHASAVYAVVVCLSVCPSVTSRCSAKTTELMITRTAPHDCPGNLVFWCWRSRQNSNWVTPNGGAKCRWGGLKLSTSDE